MALERRVEAVRFGMPPMAINAVDRDVWRGFRPIVWFFGTWFAAFGGIWVLLEPLGLFGDQDWFKDAGLLGYAALAASALLIAIVVNLVRLTWAYRSVAQRLADEGDGLGLTPVDWISSQAGIDRQTVAKALRELSEPGAQIGSPPLAQIPQLAGIVRMVNHLGLVKPQGNGIGVPNEESSILLRQLADLVRHGASFQSAWAGDGAAAKAWRRAVISSIEDQRENVVPSPEPIRSVESVFVLLFAKIDGEVRVLTTRSDAWKDSYYWFIGGIREPIDTSLEATAYRELHEETGIDRQSVYALQSVGQMRDLRRSGRLGVLSDYHYHLFHCVLKPDASVSLPYPAGLVDYRLAGRQVRADLAWRTAAELTGSEPLMRDAPGLAQLVVSAMQRGLPCIEASHLAVNSA